MKNILILMALFLANPSYGAEERACGFVMEIKDHFENVPGNLMKMSFYLQNARYDFASRKWIRTGGPQDLARVVSSRYIDSVGSGAISIFPATLLAKELMIQAFIHRIEKNMAVCFFRDTALTDNKPGIIVVNHD
jgi:hypothetical protein